VTVDRTIRVEYPPSDRIADFLVVIAREWHPPQQLAFLASLPVLTIGGCPAIARSGKDGPGPERSGSRTVWIGVFSVCHTVGRRD
jgi:hypothetical protein